MEVKNVVKPKKSKFQRWFKANKVLMLICFLLALIVISGVYIGSLYDELYQYKTAAN